MRCLRTILGVTRRDRLRNEHIREKLNMTISISEVVKKKRLRWFGHVTRRPEKSYVRKALKERFHKPRPRGRPHKRWEDQIREDTGLPLPTAERSAAERTGWRRVCCPEIPRGSRILSS